MKIQTLATRCLMKLFGLLPMQKKAVFSSHYGKYCNCNPLAVFTEMKQQRPDWTYVWLMQDDSAVIDGAAVVRPRSLRAIYHMATAALWVDNVRKPLWTVKRRGQYYVQTWHGNVALKKVEQDAASVLPEEYIANAKHDSACADLMLSGSVWQTKNYRDAFWYNGDILECGLPRSDALFGNDGAAKTRVRDFYGLTADTHLALYAPTFRADGSLSSYLSQEALTAVADALQTRFGGTWAILVRLHPSIAGQQNAIAYSDRILNGSKYSEINDQILASDVLFTDYSSCMFDAMSAKRTVFLYIPDLDAYLDDRGIYWDMEQLPFSRAKTGDALIENLLSHDECAYAAAVEQFENAVGIVCNPSASRDAVRYILSKCSKK